MVDGLVIILLVAELLRLDGLELAVGCTRRELVEEGPGWLDLGLEGCLLSAAITLALPAETVQRSRASVSFKELCDDFLNKQKEKCHEMGYS